MLKVVFISRMPVAGAPWETMKCLKKYADMDVRWICDHDGYPDGRKFPADLVLSPSNKAECLQLIANADIVHIHCDHPFQDSDFAGKKLIVQHHSVPKRGTYEMYKKLGGDYYTVSQPWLMREYSDLPHLPNLMDVEEHVPAVRSNEKPVVAFAPSNNWKIGMVGSRGKTEVDYILQKFGDQIETRSIVGVPYLRNLEMKRSSDILIDDVVGDTFHKTTLEGCCFGLAVITSWESDGWAYSNLSSLPDTLRELVQNRARLEDLQRKSREWILNEWHPRDLVKEYVDAYSKLMDGKPKGTLCYPGGNSRERESELKGVLHEQS